jgi:peptidoglycan hydrolase-like protein with peptidoglycan-binding domain
MRGPAVRKLQHRLAQLHYYPGRVNGRFGHKVTEAVWAFKEVQGISTASRPDQVGSAEARRGGRTLIGVVLHVNPTSDWNALFTAARQLLNWGFRQI